MVKKKNHASLFVLGGVLAILFCAFHLSAFGQSQPRLSHPDCVGDCVVDVYFLHSEMGDTAAKNFYHNWFNTYYDLTECNTSWKSEFSFLLDVISDIVGAPGAPTLQCWQGVLGQARTCEQACNNYFIRDGKYAPNVKLTLNEGDQGHLEVTVDNHSNREAIPELETNAYSRKFNLNIYLKWNDGEPLLIHKQEMPSLSFPNWIKRMGYDDCINAYGIDDDRCSILEAFLIPDETTTTVDFLNGVFYDLTDQVESLSDAEGSFRQNGYIRLLSNGDSITIKQGDFSGFAWIKTYNISKNTHTEEVIDWDAHQNPVTITNHECYSLFSTCWLFNDRTEVDTYVFALQGPADKMLEGTYQVDVKALMEHDKDLSDNQVSYSYEASPTVEGGETETNGGIETEYPQVGDLPIIDLPAPGIYENVIPSGMPGVLYRLSVPANLQSLTFKVAVQSNHTVNTFIKRGTIPVPDYPTINVDYELWLQASPNNWDSFPILSPIAGDYYIFVAGEAGAAFQLDIQWLFHRPTATATPLTPPVLQTPSQTTTTPQPLTTPLVTPSATTFTEVEENNHCATANAWDMQNPFSGQLTANDVDQVLVTFHQPAIYTFRVDAIGSELQPDFRLIRYTNRNVIQTSRASAKGSSTELTFGAIAGDQYCLAVSGVNLRSNLPPQAYRITLSQVIPDPDEPNDSRLQATAWDMQSPYSGYLVPSWSDRDYFLIKFTQSAIYSFTAVDISQTQRLNFKLINKHGNVLLSSWAKAKGEAVTLTFAALAGEEYYFSITSSGSEFGSINQYQFSLSNLIPDADEPNDSRAQAVTWDMQTPYMGYLVPSWRDRDYFSLHFTQSAIYTITAADLSRSQKLSLKLISPNGNVLLSNNAKGKGEAVNLTFDASAGETFYLSISTNLSEDSAINQYQLSLSDVIPDTGEPNDDREHATFWEISAGPIQGYFWDGVRGQADYIKFIAPPTKDNAPITFTVTNPSSDIRIGLSLINSRGYVLKSIHGDKGEAVSLTSLLEANKGYYLRLASIDNNTSPNPYTLSAAYIPDETNPGSSARTVRLFGWVFLRTNLVPLPMAGVEIYGQVEGKPAVSLATTNLLGYFTVTMDLAVGQEVQLWAVKPNYGFLPRTASWIVEARSRSHRFIFSGVESPVIQSTASVTPSLFKTSTPTPKPMRSETPLPNPSATPQPPHPKPLPTNTVPVTLPPLTPTTSAGSGQASVTGHLWRLFPQSEPAGVGAGQVQLMINGVAQPPVMSMIDGSYSLTLPALKAGDTLRLAASGAEDQYEPIYYEWQAEAGVNHWDYDFYSYWGTITPPPRDDQNRIYGRVTNAQGQGVPNLYILVQMGNSDALQRIGPTNAEGYYEGFVRLPNRIMVTVWVEQAGFVPSRQQFFHAFASENRQIDFIQVNPP